MREATPKIDLNDYLRLKQKDPSRFLLVLSIVVGAWIGLGALVLATQSLSVKLALWSVMSFVVGCFFQLWHETWHFNVFASRRASTVLGYALGLPFGILFEPTRQLHINHHRYNRTSKDHGAYDVGKKSLFLSIRYYGVALFAVPAYFFHFNFTYPTLYFGREQLFRHWVMVVAAVGFYLGIFKYLQSANLLSVALDTWIIPLLLSSPWIGLKSVADHHKNEWAGNPARMATTVVSNRFLSFFWFGHNFHIEHHLYPSIPGFRLTQVHALLKDRLQEMGSPMHQSYARLFLECLVEGPDIEEVETVYDDLKRVAT